MIGDKAMVTGDKPDHPITKIGSKAVSREINWQEDRFFGDKIGAQIKIIGR